MLDWVREGDTIFIHDLSRIARSTKDLLELLDTLEAKGVALVSNKESIDTSTATGKLMITMIAAINEFERANLLERQREGIAIAKREGKYHGRKAVTIPDLPRHYERYRRREISKAALARELGVSRPTLDKLFQNVKKEETTMMDNDTTGLSNNAELPDDLGQATDEDICLYDEQQPKDLEPFFDDVAIPDCEGSDDMGPPDDPQKASNTGQVSNTGLTENEILEGVVDNAIASLKSTDTPKRLPQMSS